MATSEIVSAAEAVLVARSDGVWLTAEGREAVLRALEQIEADRRDAEAFRAGRIKPAALGEKWIGAAEYKAVLGEAECGETTDATIFWLHAEHRRPPADDACVDCATTAGWTEPEERSRLPEEEREAQGALDLAVDDDKGPCAFPGCGKRTRKASISDEFELRDCFKPYVGKRLCHEHMLQVAREGAIDETKCESPECQNHGEEDSETGGRFCTALHLGVDISIRREWHFAKYPELKPKTEKSTAIRTKKARRKASEAADG